MHARAPTAFMISLTLHAGVVLAIAMLAFVVQHNERPPVQVFELVAGPPTDLTATEAPALGTPEGEVDVKIHEMPAKPEPAAPAIVPVPAVIAPPEVVAPPARPETKPAPKTSAKTESKVSYKDFVAKHGLPSSSKSTTAGAPRAGKAPQIKTRGIPDGVVGGSSRSHGGGGGKALTAAQHSALEAYTSRLVAALRQNHQKPPGLSDLLSADVECLIGADGSISGVRVVRTSGNGAFDQSCLEAFVRIGSIGPTPDGKSGTWTIKFHMVDPD
jgi:TonB family protein